MAQKLTVEQAEAAYDRAAAAYDKAKDARDRVSAACYKAFVATEKAYAGYRDAKDREKGGGGFLAGKTIATVEDIEAEYGRTYKRYLCLTFTDGSRQVLASNGEPYKPRPSVEEMKKAPRFFSVEEIAAEVARGERKRRQNLVEAKERKLAEYKRLGRDLGMEIDE